MSEGFYSQFDEKSPYYEEDPDLVRVCPDCGEPVLISEYGGTYLCENCWEEGAVSNLSCKESQVTHANRTEETQ